MCIRDSLRDANIQTTDELCRHMKKKYELSAYADHKITLMAVDSEGGYYTESGKRGLFRDLDYFEESPEKTSFVFDSMTDNQSKMVFLNRLPEPIYLQNGEKKTSILYFGIAQDMEQLNPYFNCEAYNGNNSVYVLDDNGSKLFNSNQVELIKGHNVFSVLQNMKSVSYTHLGHDWHNRILCNCANDHFLWSGKNCTEVFQTYGQSHAKHDHTQKNRRIICHPCKSDVYKRQY